MAHKLREAGSFDDPRDIDGPEMIDQYGTEQAAAMILYEVKRVEMTAEEIETWAETQETPTTAKTWAHLLRVAGLLNEITDLSDNLLTNDQVHKLRDSADMLEELLNVSNDSSKALYNELVEETADQGFQTETVLEEAESVTTWLDEHMTAIDERQTGFPDLEDHTNGANILSYTVIADELQQDVYSLLGKVPGTKLMPLPDPLHAAKRLLAIVLGLGIFGILLPLLFLITPSSTIQLTLTTFHIQLIQTALLITSTAFTILLFRELYNFIKQRAQDI